MCKHFTEKDKEGLPSVLVGSLRSREIGKEGGVCAPGYKPLRLPYPFERHAPHVARRDPGMAFFVMNDSQRSWQENYRRLIEFRTA